MHFRVFLVLALFTLIRCQKHKKNGEEIADSLYRHPKECKDPNDGGIWAPLAPGHACGSKDCNYPEQWCSARSSSRSVPQFNCVKLPEDCQKALKKEDANTTTRTTPSKSSTSTTASSTAAPEVASTNAPTEKTTTAEPTTTEEVERTTFADTSSEEVETPKPRAKGKRKESDEEGEDAVEVKPPPAPAKPADTCKDGHPLCCYWANNFQPLGSECYRNAGWMRTTCQKSCGTCGCTISNFATCQPKINTDECPYLQGTPSFVAVPTANGGGGAFAFPTAGGNQGSFPFPFPFQFPFPVFGGTNGAGPFIRAIPSSSVQVPLGSVNGALVPQQIFGGGASSVVVPLGTVNGALGQGFGGFRPAPVVVPLGRKRRWSDQ